MIFTRRKEVYTVREFMAGKHKNLEHCKTSTLPLYGYMGLDINYNNPFKSYDFNIPYFIVFGVAGVVLISTLIEYTLSSYGNPRKAEMVESFTKVIMPIAFYVFLVIGIFRIFL